MSEKKPKEFTILFGKNKNIIKNKVYKCDCQKCCLKKAGPLKHKIHYKTTVVKKES